MQSRGKSRAIDRAFPKPRMDAEHKKALDRWRLGDKLCRKAARAEKVEAGPGAIQPRGAGGNPKGGV